MHARDARRRRRFKYPFLMLMLTSPACPPGRPHLHARRSSLPFIFVFLFDNKPLQSWLTQRKTKGGPLHVQGKQSTPQRSSNFATGNTQRKFHSLFFAQVINDVLQFDFFLIWLISHYPIKILKNGIYMVDLAALF